MLTHLRRPLVAGEIPSGEGSVFHFLDIYALGFGLEACGALFLGKAWGWVALGVVGSIFFHLLGTNWPRIKPRIWPHFASGLERISNNRLYRRSIFALMIIAFSTSVGFAFYRRYHRPSSIQSASPTKTTVSAEVESSAPISSPRSETKIPKKPKAKSPVNAVEPKQKIAQSTLPQIVPPLAGATPITKPNDCSARNITATNGVYSNGAAPDLSNVCQSRFDNILVQGTGSNKFTINGKDNAVTNNTVTNMDVEIAKDAQHNKIDRNLIQSGVPFGVIPAQTNGNGANLANIWAAQTGAMYKCAGPCGLGPFPDSPIYGVPPDLPPAKALHGSSRFVADKLSALIDEGNVIAYTFFKDNDVESLKKSQIAWQAKIDAVMSNLDSRLGDALTHVTSLRFGDSRSPEGTSICKSIAGKNDLMTIYQNTLRGFKD